MTLEGKVVTGVEISLIGLTHRNATSLNRTGGLP